MEMDSFRPHLIFFAGNDQLGNQKSVRIASDVIHKSLGLVFSKKNTQIRNDTVMGTFETDSNFEKRNKFLPI